MDPGKFLLIGCKPFAVGQYVLTVIRMGKPMREAGFIVKADPEESGSRTLPLLQKILPPTRTWVDISVHSLPFSRLPFFCICVLLVASLGLPQASPFFFFMDREDEESQRDKSQCPITLLHSALNSRGSDYVGLCSSPDPHCGTCVHLSSGILLLLVLPCSLPSASLVPKQPLRPPWLVEDSDSGAGISGPREQHCP